MTEAQTEGVRLREITRQREQEAETLRTQLAEAQTEAHTWRVADRDKTATIAALEIARDEERAARQQVERELDEAQEALAVCRQIDETFWQALKPLNLTAINVHNPGRHITDLIAQRDRALAALREYGTHRMRCPMNRYNNPGPTVRCTCGLDDALRETEAP